MSQKSTAAQHHHQAFKTRIKERQVEIPELPEPVTPAGWTAKVVDDISCELVSPDGLIVVLSHVKSNGRRFRGALLYKAIDAPSMGEIALVRKHFFGDQVVYMDSRVIDGYPRVAMTCSPDWEHSQKAQIDMLTEQTICAIETYHQHKDNPRTGALVLPAPAGWTVAQMPAGIRCFRKQQLRVVVSDETIEGKLSRVASVSRHDGSIPTACDVACVVDSFLPDTICKGDVSAQMSAVPYSGEPLLYLIREKHNLN